MKPLLVLLVLALSVPASAAPSADSLGVTVMNRDGHAATLADVVRAMAEADVVFLGEQHDDSLGHVVQHHLLRAAHERFGTQRAVVLGLEMFETDVQGVLDEYAAGLIRERDFLDAARPWGNYARDYRPMVEYAIAHGLAVVATNAPKRYVSAVSREGNLSVLDSLADEARTTMPETIAPPSDELAAAFRELMAGMASHGSMPGMPSVDGMLAAQNLRDATMAWAMARAMSDVRAETFSGEWARGERSPWPLAIHLDGAFHSDGGLGIPEHLARIAPGLRVLTITIGPDAAPGRDAFAIRTR